MNIFRRRLYMVLTTEHNKSIQIPIGLNIYYSQLENINGTSPNLIVTVLTKANNINNENTRVIIKINTSKTMQICRIRSTHSCETNLYRII